MTRGDFQPRDTVFLRQKLRKDSSKPEQFLWRYLRKKNLGYKFVRQYGIGKYVIDFYCPQKKLAIELDGSQHAEERAQKYDKNRTKYIESQKIKVVRVWNNELYKNLEGVLNFIFQELEKR